MRAMTEHAPSMANIRVPIELLREWTLVAVQSRDCALLGRAMTLASAAGHSLQDVNKCVYLQLRQQRNTRTERASEKCVALKGVLLIRVRPRGSLHLPSNKVGTRRFASFSLSPFPSLHSRGVAQVLGSPGSVEAALLEITALFAGNPSSSSGGAAAATAADSNASSSGGVSTELTAPPSVPVVNSGGPQGSLSSLAELPECAKWVLEDRDAPGSRGTLAQRLVLEKWVVNGKATFLTNKAFEVHIMSREALQASWQARRAPSTELFLHPDDSGGVCSFVGQLWKSLAPVESLSNGSSDGFSNAAAAAASASRDLTLESTADQSPTLPPFPVTTSSSAAGAESNSGGTCTNANEKTCMRNLPSSVRIWASWPKRGYVHCDGRVQV